MTSTAVVRGALLILGDTRSGTVEDALDQLKGFLKRAHSNSLGSVATELGRAISARVCCVKVGSDDSVAVRCLQLVTDFCISADKQAILSVLRACLLPTMLSGSTSDRVRRQIVMFLGRALRRCPHASLTIVDGCLRPALDLDDLQTNKVALSLVADLAKPLVLSLDLVVGSTASTHSSQLIEGLNGVSAASAAAGAYARLVQACTVALSRANRAAVSEAAGDMRSRSSGVTTEYAVKALSKLKSVNEKGWAHALSTLAPSGREAIVSNSEQIRASAAASSALVAKALQQPAAAATTSHSRDYTVDGHHSAPQSRSRSAAAVRHASGAAAAGGGAPSGRVSSSRTMASRARGPMSAMSSAPRAASPRGRQPDHKAEVTERRMTVENSATNLEAVLPLVSPSAVLASRCEQPEYQATETFEDSELPLESTASLLGLGADDAADAFAESALCDAVASRFAPAPGGAPLEIHVHEPDPVALGTLVDDVNDSDLSVTALGSEAATTPVRFAPVGRLAGAVKALPLSETASLRRGSAGYPPQSRGSVASAQSWTPPSLNRSSSLELQLQAADGLHWGRRPSACSASTEHMSIHSLPSMASCTTTSTAALSISRSREPADGESLAEDVVSRSRTMSASYRQSDAACYHDASPGIEPGASLNGTGAASRWGQASSSSHPPRPNTTALLARRRASLGRYSSTGSHMPSTPQCEAPPGGFSGSLPAFSYSSGGISSRRSSIASAISSSTGAAALPPDASPQLRGEAATVSCYDADSIAPRARYRPRALSTGGFSVPFLDVSTGGAGGSDTPISVSALYRRGTLGTEPGDSDNSQMLPPSSFSTPRLEHSFDRTFELGATGDGTTCDGESEPWDDDGAALGSTTSTGPKRLFSMRMGRRRALSVTQSAAGGAQRGQSAGAVRGPRVSRWASADSDVPSSLGCDSADIASTSRMQALTASADDDSAYSLASPSTAGMPTPPSTAGAVPRTRKRSVSVSHRLGRTSSVPLPLTDLISSEADGAASVNTARRTPLLDATFSLSSTASAALPSAGSDSGPVYLSSSELQTLPQPASAIPRILAGLTADNTQWETQFDAVLLLRRLCVHHSDVLLEPGAPQLASSPSRLPGGGDLTAVRARGRSAGAATLRLPLASPTGAVTAATSTPLVLLTPLLACADSLRSAVARHALMGVVDIWAAAGRLLDSELDAALALLLRRASDTNAFLSDAALGALDAVVAHAGEARLLSALVTACGVRNSTMRCSAAPWLDRAVSRVLTGGGAPQQLLPRPLAEKLVATAAAQLNEGAAQARHAGHRLVARLRAAGVADDRAVLRLQDSDSLKVREALARPPPADPRSAPAAVC